MEEDEEDEEEKDLSLEWLWPRDMLGFGKLEEA